jgi:hypothetical protein
MKIGHGKPAPAAGSYVLSGGTSEVGSVYEEVTGCEQVLIAGGTFPT